jgi:hypothetical protein
MAKIAKTDGSIYFLRDVDYLTGEIGRYVKIGLVRKEKSTEQRIKEHQTGNPRGIKDVHTMTGVPFVEKLETQLHYRYIDRWIAGEWMDLNDGDLKAVIKEGERLKDEQIRFKDAIIDADDLAKQISNGKVIPSNENLDKLKDEYLKKHEECEVVSGELKLIRSELVSKLGKGGSIQGVISISLTSAGTTFNSKKFEEEHPELYRNYLVDKEDKIGGTFSVVGKQMFKKIAPDLDEKIKALPKEDFKDNDLEQALSLTEEVKQIHLRHLELLKREKVLEWEMDLLESQLKSAVAMNDGIEGVCNWKREKKEQKPQFDESKFKTELPELYAQFSSPKPGVYKVTINNTRPYPV